MAKKENATKNFVLRIDAEMMDAGLRMNSAAPMARYSTFWIRHYERQAG